MIITGTGAYTYDFYYQSGMSAKFQTDSIKDMSVRFLTNSGGNYYYDLIFKSGKIFAGKSLTSGGMNLIGGYAENSNINFEFRYGSNKCSLYINEKIKMSEWQILHSQTLQTTENPYITGIRFSGGTNQNVTGSLEIFGDQPGVNFSNLYEYNYPSQTGYYSGYVYITGQPGILNKIIFNNGYQYQIPSTQFNSGNYIISGLNFASGSSINADFYFNFGKINTDLYFYIPSTRIAAGFLNVSQSDSDITYSGMPYPYQYTDYSVTNTITNTGNFRVYLEFLNRSGDMTISGTGTITGNLTGYLSGSGYIYGSGTGFTTYGYYSQRGQQILINNFNSGYSREMIPRFVYPTGEIVYPYIIMATGTEDSFSGPVFTSGYISGYLTGILNDGSGKYNFVGYVTGRPKIWNGVFPTGNQSTGGYYYTQDTNSYYLDTYSSQNYTGFIDQTVYWTGIYSKQFTEQFSQIYYSGFSSTNSGYISRFDLKTGSLEVLTGDYNYVNSNYYSYTGHGNLSGRYLIKTATPVGPGVYQYGIRVSYDRNIPQEMKDSYKITFTDGVNTESITGFGFYL